MGLLRSLVSCWSSLTAHPVGQLQQSHRLQSKSTHAPQSNLTADDVFVTCQTLPVDQSSRLTHNIDGLHTVRLHQLHSTELASDLHTLNICHYHWL